MDRDEIVEDARLLIADALSRPEELVDSGSRIYDFPEWDSLGQLNIALTLEAKYGVGANDARMFARLSSVQAIASILCAERADRVEIDNTIGGPPIPASFYSSADCDSTLVLIHGISANRHEWGFYDLVALEALGSKIAVLAIDSQGHGESKVSIENLSLRGIVDEIVSAQNWVEKRVPTSNYSMLMGNSFGGGTALMAGCELNVALVALSCSVTSYIADLKRANPGITEPVRESIPYSKLLLPREIYTEMTDFDAQLSRLRPEFLVQFFHGEADTDVPFSEAFEFSKNLPNVEFSAFPGMDHTYTAPINEKQRDEKTVRYREIAAKRIVEELRNHVQHALLD